MCTAARQTVTCPKCYSSKRLPQYAAIAEGVCFTCAGVGTIALDTSKTLRSGGAAETRPSAESAVNQLRVWYAIARDRMGVEWFANEGESGVGMSAVRWYCEALPAEQGAKIVAAFESLRDSL